MSIEPTIFIAFVSLVISLIIAIKAVYDFVQAAVSEMSGN